MNSEGSGASCLDIQQTAYQQAIHLLGQGSQSVEEVERNWTVLANLENASQDVHLVNNQALKVITVEIKRKANTGLCIFCSPEYFTKIPDGDGANDKVWARSSFAIEGTNACS